MIDKEVKKEDKCDKKIVVNDSKKIKEEYDSVRILRKIFILKEIFDTKF